MSIEQLLAEQTRLTTELDAVQQHVRTAGRRYRRTRDRGDLRVWDMWLAAQDQAVALVRANSRALRDSVEAV